MVKKNEQIRESDYSRINLKDTEDEIIKKSKKLNPILILFQRI